MRVFFACFFLLGSATLSGQVVSLRLFECPEPVPPVEMPIPLGEAVQSGFMDFLFDEGYIATSERSARAESDRFRAFEGQDLEDAVKSRIDFVVDAMVTFKPSRFRKELWIPTALSWRVLNVKTGIVLKEGKLDGIQDDGEITKEAPVSSRKLGRNLAEAVSRFIFQGRGI